MASRSATPKPGLRRRVRYWFDNTMAKGTPALVGWLAILSLLLVATVSAALAVVDSDRFVHLFRETVTSALELDLPDNGSIPSHLIWFVLGIGGLFVVSALIGLLDNGIEEKISDLRKGRSPVVEKDHTVILGWSDQVFVIASELVNANRSRRKAAIVILAEEDKLVMDDAIQHRLGDTGRTRIVCRTGNPLDVKDLELVNLSTARSVIIVRPQTPQREDSDAFVLKTLLAINRSPAFRDSSHHVVTSVRDASSRAVAKLAGGTAIVIDADDISARLIVQAARHSGLSAVYHNLMDFGGDEMYIATAPELVGRTFGEALLAYDRCCAVGLMAADGTTKLNPPMETVITEGDQIVVIAGDDSAIRLADDEIAISTAAIIAEDAPALEPEHTLVLGWNGRAARIIEQLDTYVAADSTVEVITDRSEVGAAIGELAYNLVRLTATVKDGDTRSRKVLEGLDIGRYDNVIVLCDDHLAPLTADSRVLVTLLHLRDILAKRGQTGAIVTEIRDDRDRELAQLTRDDDFVISDRLVSLLMTQISENAHLEPVFADLYDSAGAEIYIRDASHYVRPDGDLTFATVVASARLRGEVAIGYRIADSDSDEGMVINPDKNAIMPVIDRLVVLASN
jgi:voltage-gated potassium channel Kch